MSSELGFFYLISQTVNSLDGMKLIQFCQPGNKQVLMVVFLNYNNNRFHKSQFWHATLKKKINTLNKDHLFTCNLVLSVSVNRQLRCHPCHWIAEHTIWTKPMIPINDKTRRPLLHQAMIHVTGLQCRTLGRYGCDPHQRQNT